MHKAVLPVAAVCILGAGGLGILYYQKLKHFDAVVAARQPREARTPTSPSAPTPAAKPTLTSSLSLSGASLEAMRLLQARFNAGDYGAALDLADHYTLDNIYSAEFHAWLSAQMPVLLISAGWLRLKLGDCDNASILLRRAESIHRSEETSKGLAYCYYKLRNWLGADEQFSAYLQLKPDDYPMQALYADVLESDRRYAEAVKVLEKVYSQDRLKDATADKAEINQRLESMRAKAKESVNQTVVHTAHISLTFRTEEHEALAPVVLDTLEQAIDEFTERLGFREPQAMIEVVLYPQTDFSSLVAGSPDWAQGIYDGRMRIPVSAAMASPGGQTQLARVLRHELVHALVALMTDARPMPPWFNEGLAQRLECKGAERCIAEFPPRRGDFLAQQAFNVPYTSYEALLAERSYRQSLYLINTIEYERDGEDGLKRILESLGPSSNLTSDGLLAPLGITFDRLYQQAAMYWQRGGR